MGIAVGAYDHARGYGQVRVDAVTVRRATKREVDDLARTLGLEPERDVDWSQASGWTPMLTSSPAVDVLADLGEAARAFTAAATAAWAAVDAEGLPLELVQRVISAVGARVERPM
jgi:hypothetical protein